MGEIPQFLYRIQPTRPGMLSEGPTAEEAAIVGAHFEYLKRLMDKGVVILAGRTQTTDSSSFGIVIFRAESPEKAESIVQADPAVSGGVMSAELFPYRIALMASPMTGIPTADR